MNSQPLASPPPYSYHYQPSAPPNEQGYLLPRQPLLIAHGNTRYIIKKRNADSRHFPVNASFFLLGFLCPPIWFIASCCWPKSKNKYEVFWRKLNVVMSIISIILFLFFSIIICILVWEEIEYNHHPRRDIPQFILSLLFFFIT